MKKFSIYVYAICKNEEKFVDRWVNSMSEADGIIVIDTGSNDNTVNKLKEHNVKVYEKTISPWRFDVARNISLSHVPEDADICVCTDLDEVFEPGWRKKVENSWSYDTQRLSYRYTWNFNKDGSEGYVFWIDKIHSRNNFKWIHPVHEVLQYTGQNPYITKLAEGVQLNHHADESKPRTQYLTLLELSVTEDPYDDRNMHYLGREYMFHKEWQKCISTLKKHLKMPNAQWKDERAASMRYIAKSYYNLGNIEKSKTWYLRSIAEAPHLREPYIDMALLLYDLKEWMGVIYMCESAIKIKDRPKTYICEAASWGSLPYDLLSISYYQIKNYKEALKFAEQAVTASPHDERLLRNLEIIKRENLR